MTATQKQPLTLNPWQPGDLALFSGQPVKVLNTDGTRCCIVEVGEDNEPLSDATLDCNMDALSPRKQWPERPAPRPIVAQVLTDALVAARKAADETTPPTEAPILYPIGSTAYSASLVTYVTIKDAKHDTREVGWYRGDSARVFTNSLNINELSDSDDPYTRTVLGQDGKQASTTPAPDAAPMHDTETESALIGWTQAKMAVTGQPTTITLHPADPLTIDQAGESTIAQQEIDAAQMANALGDRIAERDATIKMLEVERETLKTRLRAQTSQMVRVLQERDAAEQELERLTNQRDDDEDYSTLEHLIMESNAELSQRIKSLEQKASSPLRSTIETTTKRNIPDAEIAALINTGWRVVFETVYIQPGNASHTHLLRFEREIIDADTPPQDEAHAAASVPLFAGVVTAVGETPTESDVVIEPPVHEITFHVGAPSYIPIDPAEIDLSQPLWDNLSKYGPDAMSKAQDLAIMDAIAAAKDRYMAAMPPVRTLTQALHQHA